MHGLKIESDGIHLACTNNKNYLFACLLGFPKDGTGIAEYSYRDSLTLF